MFFMIIPYHVDVPMRHVPWANWVIIVLTVPIYPFCLNGDELSSLGETLTLGMGSLGFVGHVLVHAGPLHLIGNMIFLWVFGNAVCGKVGNLAYPFIYFGLGICSGLLSLAITQKPGVGCQWCH